jgi:hypoxanthine-DNA glycosylase
MKESFKNIFEACAGFSLFWSVCMIFFCLLSILNTGFVPIFVQYTCVLSVCIFLISVLSLILFNVNKKQEFKRGLPAFNLEKAKFVILGTFPGEKSLCAKKYYSDNSNHFWILLGLKKHDFKTLKKLNIGLWDVIESCERSGSIDKNIKNPKYNDLSVLQGKKIFFNGKEAYKHFVKAQKQQNIDFKVSEKNILPSSSSATRIDFKTKQRHWNKIA